MSTRVKSATWILRVFQLKILLWLGIKFNSLCISLHLKKGCGASLLLMLFWLILHCWNCYVLLLIEIEERFHFVNYAWKLRALHVGHWLALWDESRIFKALYFIYQIMVFFIDLFPFLLPDLKWILQCTIKLYLLFWEQRVILLNYLSVSARHIRANSIELGNWFLHFGVVWQEHPLLLFGEGL